MIDGAVTADRCQHGSRGDSVCTAGAAELSSCCSSFVTYGGDGDLYCKCCGNSAEWSDDVGIDYIRVGTQ